MAHFPTLTDAASRVLQIAYNASPPLVGAPPEGGAGVLTFEARRAALFEYVKGLDEDLKKNLETNAPYTMATFLPLVALLAAFVIAVIVAVFGGTWQTTSMIAGGGILVSLSVVIYLINSLQQIQHGGLRTGFTVSRHLPRIAVATTEEELKKIADELAADLKFREAPQLSLDELRKALQAETPSASGK